MYLNSVTAISDFLADPYFGRGPAIQLGLNLVMAVFKINFFLTFGPPNTLLLNNLTLLLDRTEKFCRTFGPVWKRLLAIGAWHPSLSCRLPHRDRVLMYSWRSTILSLRKKLTSSTANLEYRHVHFSCDSYSSFICWKISPGKNSMELFLNTKFNFESTQNRDWAAYLSRTP